MDNILISSIGADWLERARHTRSTIIVEFNHLYVQCWYQILEPLSPKRTFYRGGVMAVECFFTGRSPYIYHRAITPALVDTLGSHYVPVTNHDGRTHAEELEMMLNFPVKGTEPYLQFITPEAFAEVNSLRLVFPQDLQYTSTAGQETRPYREGHYQLPQANIEVLKRQDYTCLGNWNSTIKGLERFIISDPEKIFFEEFHNLTRNCRRLNVVPKIHLTSDEIQLHWEV